MAGEVQYVKHEQMAELFESLYCKIDELWPRPAKDGLEIQNFDESTIEVKVHNVRYLINEDILHQVFDPCERVEKIVIVSTSALKVVARVTFSTRAQAAYAIELRQGRNIFDHCCGLSVHFLILDVEVSRTNELNEDKFESIEGKDLEMLRTSQQVKLELKASTGVIYYSFQIDKASNKLQVGLEVLSVGKQRFKLTSRNKIELNSKVEKCFSSPRLRAIEIKRKNVVRKEPRVDEVDSAGIELSKVQEKLALPKVEQKFEFPPGKCEDVQEQDIGPPVTVGSKSNSSLEQLVCAGKHEKGEVASVYGCNTGLQLVLKPIKAVSAQPHVIPEVSASNSRIVTAKNLKFVENLGATAELSRDALQNISSTSPWYVGMQNQHLRYEKRCGLDAWHGSWAGRKVLQAANSYDQLPPDPGEDYHDYKRLNRRAFGLNGDDQATRLCSGFQQRRKLMQQHKFVQSKCRRVAILLVLYDMGDLPKLCCCMNVLKKV